MKTARKVAGQLKEELGGTTKESPRLITEDKNTGKGLYRTWISFRLPKINVGDFIRFNSKIARITAITGSRIQVEDLESHEDISLKWRDYDSMEMIASEDDVEKAMISSISPAWIQILDPEDYSPIDFEMNEKFKDLNIGDEIDVLKYENKIFII